MDARGYDPAMLEQRFQDAVTRFLESANAVPPPDVRDAVAAPFLFSLAEALGRFLMEVPLLVAWEAEDSVEGVCLRAFSAEARAEAEAPSGVRRALDELDRSEDVARYEPITLGYAWNRDGWSAIRIGGTFPGQAGRYLWVVRQAPAPPGVTWSWLRSYHQGLRHLYVSFHALVQAQVLVAERLALSRLENAVHDLVHAPGLDDRDRLRRAADVLGELVARDSPGRLRLVDRVALWTLNQELGSGWAGGNVPGSRRQRSEAVSRPAQGTPGGGPAEDDITQWLDVVLKSLRTAHDRLDPDAQGTGSGPAGQTEARWRSELACVGETLAALRAPESCVHWERGECYIPPEPASGIEGLMQLLPEWTWIHRWHLDRERSMLGAATRIDEPTWKRAVTRTRGVLGKYLSLVAPGSSGNGEQRKPDATSTRNWLTLWFVLEFLERESTADGGNPRLDGERGRYRRDLAYLLRECLRFACFGDRNDYRSDPATFAAALRTLVEHHLRWVVGAGRKYLIEDLLLLVGDERQQAGYHSAAEHLRHLLEVYMAGHFLLSLEVRPPVRATSPTPAPPREPAARKLKIFLSYASEDREEVEKLYEKLEEWGHLPWMDKKDPLLGDDVGSSLDTKIREIDLFIACVSTASRDKVGFVQAEIQTALDQARQYPAGLTFIVSVLLEATEPPKNLKKRPAIEWFDEEGPTRLERFLEEEAAQRARAGRPGRSRQSTSGARPRRSRPADRELRTVAELLADPVDMTPAQLCEAFSLAALFHDVGHLLYPRELLVAETSPPLLTAGGNEVGPGGGPRIPDRDLGVASIEKTLGSVSDSFAVPGRELVGACRAALEAGYPGEAVTGHEEKYRIVGNRDDNQLMKWMEEQRKKNRPDHGITGAWYLREVCGQGDGAPAVAVPAIRATLLHNAVTVGIDAARDPVAALLVFCNEIFSWNPARHLGPAPSSVGRSLHLMAADVPPHEPRNRAIKLEGFHTEFDGRSGRLETWLDPPSERDAPTRGWPRVILRLQPPERLDVSVLSLWLVKAQKLGRVSGVERYGWRPAVVLEGTIDARLLACGYSTKRLLEKTAWALGGTLKEAILKWLDDRDGRFSEDVASRKEAVVLGPLPEQPFKQTDMREQVRSVEEAALKVVERAERG